MTENQSPPGSLHGVRVLDLAGPMGVYCGKLLADLGADVIKIEEPGGDSMRSRGPFYHNLVHPEKSLYFLLYNTSKRGVTLNLETGDGQDLFKKLVQTANVVLETFTPGYMNSLGLGHDQLQAINPGIITTSITPFGQTGPYKNYKASDLIGSAMGGLTNHVGEPGERPAWTLAEASYHKVNVDASTATLIALYHQSRTGEGQYIDISLQESVAMVVSWRVLMWDVLKEIETRPQRIVRTRAGSGLFLCKDGYVEVVLRAGPPLRFLCQWLEEEGIEHDLWGDEWHDASFRSRPENVAHMDQILEPFFQRFSKREAVEKAQQHHLSIMPVYDPREVREDPHLNAKEFFVNIEHPELNDSIDYVGAPFTMSETPWLIRRKAPLIGDHNEEVFVKELGYTKQQLAIMKANGSI